MSTQKLTPPAAPATTKTGKVQITEVIESWHAPGYRDPEFFFVSAATKYHFQLTPQAFVELHNALSLQQGCIDDNGHAPLDIKEYPFHTTHVAHRRVLLPARPFFVKFAESRGTPEPIRLLVAGICESLVSMGFSVKEGMPKLLEMVRPLFPQADLYVGHTHVRVRLNGTADGYSVYIDTTGGVQ